MEFSLVGLLSLLTYGITIAKITDVLTTELFFQYHHVHDLMDGIFHVVFFLETNKIVKFRVVGVINLGSCKIPVGSQHRLQLVDVSVPLHHIFGWVYLSNSVVKITNQHICLLFLDLAHHELQSDSVDIIY